MRSLRLTGGLLASTTVMTALAMPTASAPAVNETAIVVEDMERQTRNQEWRLAALRGNTSLERHSRLHRAVAATTMDAGSKPRAWKLPGTNISMHIGGFVQLDLIYDINHFSGDGLSSNATSTDSFPSDGSTEANAQGHLRFHSRRSRLFLRSWTPSDWGALDTRIEGDFFGAGGSEVVSNSNAFRLRHAYGSFGPILAGQTNSVFRFEDIEARVLEDRGPAGHGGPRQGQIRSTLALAGGLELLMSVENPETGGAAVATSVAVPVVMSGSGAPDRVPDFAFALRHRWSDRVVRVGALLGERSIDDGLGNNGADLMWGVQGGIHLQFNRKRTSFGLLGFYGYGTGRYIRGLPAEVSVTGVSGPSLRVQTVRNYGCYAWVRHKWTDTIQTNLAFGRHDGDVEATTAKALIPARTLDFQWTIHANVICEPTRNVAFGLEYVHARTQYHNAPRSAVNRIQVSIVYGF